jgi:peptidoglycan/LPS O-acetylase OafA/YrhL
LPDWSLSVEFHFYLLFPLIAVADRRKPLLTCFVAAVFCYVSPKLFGHYTEPGQWAHFRQPALLAYRLNFFLVGCIARYLFSASTAEDDPERKRIDLVAMLLCLAVAGVRSVFGIILVVYLIAMPASPLGKVLSAPVFAWMSRISFSIYLCHVPLLRIVVAGFASQAWYVSMSPTLRFAIASTVLIPLVLLCSHLLYRFIEAPGNRLAHRVDCAPGLGLGLGRGARGLAPS